MFEDPGDDVTGDPIVCNVWLCFLVGSDISRAVFEDVGKKKTQVQIV